METRTILVISSSFWCSTESCRTFWANGTINEENSRMTFLRVISIFKKISKYEQNLNRFFVGINSKSSESNTQQNNITGKLDEQNNLETYQLRKDE